MNIILRITLFLAVCFTLGVVIRILLMSDPFAYLDRSFYAAGIGGSALRIHQGELKAYQNGILSLRMQADSIDLSQNRNDWQAINVHGASYDGRQLVMEFASTSAAYDEFNKNITARNANAHSKDISLKANVLSFNNKQNTIAWDEHAEINYKQYDIHAKSGQANIGAEQVAMQTFSASRGAWKAKSDSALLNKKTDELHLSGNVSFADDNLELHCSNITTNLKTNQVAITGDKPATGIDKKNNIRIVSLGKASLDDKTGSDIFENIEFIDEGAVYKADKAIRDNKKQIISAEGNISVNDEEMELLCDKLIIDRKAKKAMATNNIRITIKPKASKASESGDNNNSPKETRRFPITASAEKVEYFYGKKRVAVLTGSVKGKQILENNHWREVFADTVHYDRDAEKLTIAGDIKLTDDRGMELYPELVEIIIKDGEEELSFYNLSKTKNNTLPSDNNEEGEEEPPPPPSPKKP